MEICLVLSGGAARGLAHIGVLKALLKGGIKIRAISGSSAGAIVGAFASAGYTPDKMVEIAQSVSPFKVFKPSFPPKVSLLSGKPVEEFFRSFLPKSFEELEIPLWVSATDLKTGEGVLINGGDLPKAVTASSALPPFFPPVELEGRLLNDGGFTNDLPVEPFLRKNCFRLCVDVTPLGEKEKFSSPVDVAIRSLFIALRGIKLQKYTLCDRVLIPDLRGYSFVNYRAVDKLVEKGFECGVEFLKSL
ncbi:MAG TPA: patatin-like phospholipase family protein [Aquifex aeolicus]|nr:patatin-like phospholipase family protein [Aquifex aeolicus]